jgi:hypothetical protein
VSGRYSSAFMVGAAALFTAACLMGMIRKIPYREIGGANSNSK